MLTVKILGSGCANCKKLEAELKAIGARVDRHPVVDVVNARDVRQILDQREIDTYLINTFD